MPYPLTNPFWRKVLLTALFTIGAMTFAVAFWNGADGLWGRTRSAKPLPDASASPAATTAENGANGTSVFLQGLGAIPPDTSTLNLSDSELAYSRAEAIAFGAAPPRSNGNGRGPARRAEVSASRAQNGGGGGSSSAGYSLGGITSFAGAWGGASGQVQPRNAAAEPLAISPSGSEQSLVAAPPANGGSGGSAASTPTLPPSASATAVAVVPLATAQAGGAAVSSAAQALSPASSPASTPEPMTMILVGTGLAGLYRLRRHFE